MLLLILADNELKVTFGTTELSDLFWLKEEGYLQKDEWSDEVSLSSKGQNAVEAAIGAA